MAEPSLSLPAALRSDEGVRRLVRVLALSDQFHFCLVLCDTPRMLRALLDVLVRDVTEEREEPVRVIRLDPYERLTDFSHPIPFERIAGCVLERLTSPPHEEKSADVVFVADGSRALPADDEAWSLFFLRLNERRNVIAQKIRGALLLCIPRRLEAAFAHAAPDFWSIRSLTVLLDVSVPAKAPRHVLLPSPALMADRSAELKAAQAEKDREAADADTGLEAARARFAAAPEDEAALSALAIGLRRRAEQELRWGALDRALDAAEESVAIERRRLERRLDATPGPDALAVALDVLGDAHFRRGNSSPALAAYEEALRLRREAMDSDRAQVREAISSSLYRIGNALRMHGQLDRALAVYDEGIQIIRDLLKRVPEQVQYLQDLSAYLVRIGDGRQDRDALEGALEAYEEAAATMRHLLARNPEWPPWRDTLSAILRSIGTVHSRRGDLDRALAAFEQAQQIIHDLLKWDPAPIDWWRTLWLHGMQIGDVHLQRGELDRALASYREALEIARSLAEAHTDQPDLRDDVAMSLIRHAELAEAAGRPAEAVQSLREALAELDPITSAGGPALQLWKSHAEACRRDIARLEASLAKPAT